MPNKLIVYDLDGTLADTAQDLCGALNHALLTQQLKPVSVSQVRALVGAGARKLIERALALRGAAQDEDKVLSMIDVLLHYYKEHICDKTVLYPQIPQTLKALADMGYKQAICTNKPQAMADLLVQKLGIAPYMCALTGGDTFPYRKPDARHVLETIRRAGSTPEKTIFVGDSLTDLNAANNASIPVVMVPWGYILEEDMAHIKPVQMPQNASLLETILAIKL